MNFFVFGAGFSAKAAIASIKARRPEAKITATTRDAQKAARLADQGIAPLIWDGENANAAVIDAVKTTTHLLVSVAPDATGDRVLNAFSDAIATAPDLGWIGYYSTVGVYGDAEGGWIDETAPTRADSDRAAWRIDAEAGWQKLAEDKNIPLAILRLAGIYGPGRSAFDKLAAGKAYRVIKPGQVFNRIHNGDIGDITAKAAAVRLGGVYNLADDEPAPPQDLVTYAAQLMGSEPPPEIAFEDADLSPMARSFYANSRKVANARIKAALDHELLYPNYRAGLDAIWQARGAKTGD